MTKKQQRPSSKPSSPFPFPSEPITQLLPLSARTEAVRRWVESGHPVPDRLTRRNPWRIDGRSACPVGVSLRAMGCRMHDDWMVGGGAHAALLLLGSEDNLAYRAVTAQFQHFIHRWWDGAIPCLAAAFHVIPEPFLASDLLTDISAGVRETVLAGGSS